jgi:hypothetical protein
VTCAPNFTRYDRHIICVDEELSRADWNGSFSQPAFPKKSGGQDFADRSASRRLSNLLLPLPSPPISALNLPCIG